MRSVRRSGWARTPRGRARVLGEAAFAYAAGEPSVVGSGPASAEFARRADRPSPTTVRASHTRLIAKKDTRTGASAWPPASLRTVGYAVSARRASEHTVAAAWRLCSTPRRVRRGGPAA